MHMYRCSLRQYVQIVSPQTKDEALLSHRPVAEKLLFPPRLVPMQLKYYSFFPAFARAAAFFATTLPLSVSHHLSHHLKLEL